MKSFKEFITERQSGHSEFFLTLAGDIKLDRGNACKIWEECGKRSTFRHITDTYGAEFLIRNKDKNLAISALKFSKELTGIETDGTATVIVEADYEIWWPEDAFTYIGFDGKRWIAMNKLAWKKIFPKEFASEYVKALFDMIKKKHPKVHELVESMEFYSHGTVIKHMVYHGNTLVNEPLGGVDIPDNLEKLEYEFRQDFKSESEKFVKDALSLQLKYLDKHSDVIKKNLVGEFQKSRTDKARRRNYSRRDLDEAVVSNIKVTQVILHDDENFPELVADLQDMVEYENKFKGDKTEDRKKAFIKKQVESRMKNFSFTLDVLRDAKYKGLFTFRTFIEGVQFKRMKKAVKDYPDAWTYLEKNYGIKRAKGVFLRFV